MIETEEQRRWWFATHPEFSRSTERIGSHKRKNKNQESQKYWPEDVDAYVDERLKYATGAHAELLKVIKRHMGTEASSPSRSMLACPVRAPGLLFDAAPMVGGGTRPAPPLTPRPAAGGISSGLSGRVPAPKPTSGSGLTNPSRKLAREMEKVYGPRPSKFLDAHHIVLARDSRWPEPAEARQILDKWRIDLYDPANGVWLPKQQGTSAAAYHPAVPTEAYYREVVKRLRMAPSREKAMDTLKKIGSELEKGKFPR